MTDPAPPELEIHPLTRGRLPDLRALFDQGGDPKPCQCAFWRTPASGWGDWTRERNRTVLEELASDRPAAGLVAYAAGEATPVGWVSLGPREDFIRLERSKVLARIDEAPVWSVVCFVVARKWRGKGVATALLGAAVDYAKAHGATIVEGYPVDPSRGRVPAASAYMGPLAMFEGCGFEVVETRQWNPKTPLRPIVRREL